MAERLEVGGSEAERTEPNQGAEPGQRFASGMVPAQASRAEDLAPGSALAGGRFELLRVLGRGGMGVVYEAHDRARDQRVALKHLVRFSAQGGLSLKAEFRSLAEVEHPNVVRLHELFCDERPWFFTMDLVSGVDLIRHVRGQDARVSTVSTELASDAPKPPSAQQLRPLPDLSRLQRALVQLVHGIEAIHAAHKLHCDLKPSNVLVSSDGRVRIVDFGLVTDSSAATAEHLVAGTPGYVAPERYAGAPASSASDWYSLGVIVHEALTGHLPLLPESLRQLTEAAPPELRGELAKLQALCTGLLSVDPAQRWHGAQILAALGVAHAQPTRAPSPSVPPVHLVGRTAELERFRAALRGLEEGTPSVLCLAGESGIGKSALLAQFVSEARAQANALVLQSRCYERESVRYKALDGVIDQLAVYWARLPPAEAAALLPRGAESLVQVFSVLAQVSAIKALDVQEAAAADPSERRRAAFKALRDLLTRIADRHRLLVIIDDLQWGDAESAQEILNLLGSPDAPRLLFVGAYRSTDVVQDGPLARFLSALRLSSIAHQELLLTALSARETGALALSLSERALDDALLAQIVASSQGSPFLVIELVRQGNRQAGALQVAATDLVRSRVQALEQSEQRLLELLAIAPGPVKQSVLEDAHGGEHFEGSLQSLLAGGMVRRRRGEAYDLLEPYHDRIRETCAAMLLAGARRAHHAAFVRTLERCGGAPLEVLAAHLEGAGELARAARHYGAAAERAEEALAFEHAADLQEKSLTLRAREGRVEESLPYVALARALAFAGHGPRSAAAYLEAAERAPGEQRDALQLRAAEQLLFAGHFEPGLSLLARCLPRFGLHVPRGPRWWRLLLLVWNALRVAAVKPRAAPPLADPFLRRAEICDTLGDATLYVHFGLFVHFQQQHVLAAMRTGQPARVALALTARALMIASPYPRRFSSLLKDLERARKLSEDSPDAYVRGRVALNHAVVYGAVGRYQETAAYARQAELTFRNQCRGTRWGLQHAIAWRSIAMFYLGQLRELRELCAENLPAARRRGDDMLSRLLGVWNAWVELAADRAAGALAEGPTINLSGAFTVIDAAVLSQRGPLLLYLGQVDEAWQLFARCEGRVRAVGVMSATVRANEFHWTRGLAASHRLARGADRLASRVLQRHVRKLVTSGVQDALAMAMHLEGNALMASGSAALAVEKWAAAARQYTACEMAAFAATLRLAVATHGHQVEAGADSARARATLAQCGVANAERWLALWCPAPPAAQPHAQSVFM